MTLRASSRSLLRRHTSTTVGPWWHSLLAVLFSRVGRKAKKTRRPFSVKTPTTLIQHLREKNPLPKRAPFRARHSVAIEPATAYWQRRQGLLLLMLAVIGILLGRAVYLQVMHTEFLQTQGDARHVRTVTLPAHRGLLLDRNGEPLAISTPVQSVWVRPRHFLAEQAQWPALAERLNITPADIEQALAGREQREFVYLRRHVSPSVAAAVTALKLDGVFLQQEYRRYYPEGEVTAHLLGFTDVDDEGQEGLELALDRYLVGVAGAKQVIQDPLGNQIAELGLLQPPLPGRDVRLSVDRRLQYLAYRELKAAVEAAQAPAGAAVILDIASGEVLAMVNQPGYNPNNRQTRDGGLYRNRAMTDVFEPGSTMKPFTIAAALESGHYTVNSTVDTAPGSLALGKYQVRDARNYGEIDLATIIQKSSNVGASKIALSLPSETLWSLFHQVGLGEISASGFPGEASGHLSAAKTWYAVDQATLSFGYGLNVTLLQLARAYAVFGQQGQLPPVRFLAQTKATDTAHPAVMQPQTAQAVLRMLEGVTAANGTASRAQVAGYRVAGKTGTVRKHQAGGYAENAYISLFVGLAPASAPRLVMAVMIDEAQGEQYYGGQIAAPVFASVMKGALRILNVPPDAMTASH